MWNLKDNTNEHICKTETDPDIENKRDYQRGEEQMRDIGLIDRKFHTQTR